VSEGGILVFFDSGDSIPAWVSSGWKLVGLNVVGEGTDREEIEVDEEGCIGGLR